MNLKHWAQWTGNETPNAHHGIDYVMSRIPESGASDEDREVAHSSTITRHKVQGWKKSITREKLAHAVRKEYVSENLQSPAEVHTFLKSDEVKRKMEELADGQEADAESTLRRYIRGVK